MALLDILTYPNPRLAIPSEPVKAFDESLRTLVDDMFETMYDANGVGLAAPQIGISKQLSVIDTTHNGTERIVLVNPEIIETRGEASFQEGCLSVPGAYDTVTRAAFVRVRAQDEYGKTFEIEGTDLLGECLQHEIQHLQGKLYIDLLSPLKRNRAKTKMEKFLRSQKNS